MTNLELDRVAFEAAVADRPDESFVTRAGSGLAGGLRRAASALIFPAALLLVWLTACLLDLVPEQILPDPRIILATFREFYVTGDLAFHARISLIRVVQGFALGAGAGLVLGISMG